MGMQLVVLGVKGVSSDFIKNIKTWMLQGINQKITTWITGQQMRFLQIKKLRARHSV